MRQAEHVLYITLIDFLLQLLFLGLVVGVIFAANQRMQEAAPDRAKAKDAIKSMEQIKSLTGISDLTVLTDELTRLAPLQASSKYVALGRDMEKDISRVGGKEAARKILNEHAAKRAGGQAKPSCLEGGTRVATFHAYTDRIELVTPVSSEMAELLRRLNKGAEEVSRLTLSEFVSVFSPITQLRPDCVYNVEVYEHSFDTRPRDRIRSAFWPVAYIPAADKR